MSTPPCADLSYSTAPILSVTLFWVTPSLYPIALQHTVRIHPTTDPSNNPFCQHSGDHRPLSKSTTLTLFCFNPSHPVPNESLRIISAYLWTSGILKSQTICRVIMVTLPPRCNNSSSAPQMQWFTFPPTSISSSQILEAGKASYHSGLLSHQNTSILPPFS
jgi:hypothetical protein